MSFEEDVINIIESNIEKEIKITPDTDFEELELDSFGILILVDAFEQKFKISIDNDDFLNIKKISDVINKLKN